MQQFLNVWARLEWRRQVIVVLATLAMFAAILTMSRMATTPSMTLLYAGLESGPAGDVVRALEQRNAIFEVRGGSIFVDSRERDQLRLTLASEGLPANNNQGYEILDELNGFGTTSQMFDAAYWRAKEGELARTIVSSPHIAMARVHIASSGANPFQRGVTPKASVSLTPNGSSITAGQAKAVRYLIASAVAGLAADEVSVIDSNGALIGKTDDAAASSGSEDLALALRARAQRLLEARVGFGNAIVEVSVDTITESEAIRETRFDPNNRVAISTDTEERTGTSSDAGGGDVTVASNLPDRQNEGGGDASSSQNSETRERVNYEVSETLREIVRVPGAIKRLTVAVLVNETTTVNETGETTTAPRQEAELDALRELVSSAVGFDSERGDIITIKSMALLAIPEIGTPAAGSVLERLNLDLMSLIQIAVLAIVALVMGLFVLRPMLTAAKQPAVPEASPLALAPVSTDENSKQAALTGETSNDSTQFPELEVDSSFDKNTSAGTELQIYDNSDSENPAERLRKMIDERQVETVETLRSWLEDTEENA